jgi:hypothetical protein
MWVTMDIGILSKLRVRVLDTIREQVRGSK